MEINVPKGKYIVAVSGGVDSIVLLHLLAGQPELELLVAHFDHGIRQDSAEDELFVRALAKEKDLPYISERAELGAGASEAAARDARYEFLRKTMKKHHAAAVITAHHQDDLLETMILNMLRGTGRQGLDPMRRSPDIKRPLLACKKEDIIKYARDNSLAWREDSTNSSSAYARNHIRHAVMPKLAGRRSELVGLNETAIEFNIEIGALLEALSASLLNADGTLQRNRFVGLPHKVAAEFMHWWLTKNGVKDIDVSVVNRATIAAKTLTRGKKIDLGGGISLHSGATSLAILPN